MLRGRSAARKVENRGYPGMLTHHAHKGEYQVVNPPWKSTRLKIIKRLTDKVTIGRASPLLDFDAFARQVLSQLHPPLRWHVLNGVLLNHVRVIDPEGEKVGRRVSTWGVTAPSWVEVLQDSLC